MPTFVSLFLDKMAWATNTFSIEWNEMWAYTFPLLPLLPKVLQKITEVILVAPWWPSKVWSLELLELSIEPPRALLAIETAAQPRSYIFHENPQVLRLHAWQLYHRVLSLPDSQKKWQSGRLEASFTKLL